jgi:hypothetical protein
LIVDVLITDINQNSPVLESLDIVQGGLVFCHIGHYVLRTVLLDRMEISESQGHTAQGTAATHNKLPQNTGTTKRIHTTGEQSGILGLVQADTTVIL